MNQLAGESQSTSVRTVAAYIAISFAFSWAQWFAVIASSKQWIAFHVPLTPLGSFGPLLAAVLVLPNKDDRRAWYRSIAKWRVSPPILLVASLALPAAAGACFIASAFLSGGAAHPVFPSPGI